MRMWILMPEFTEELMTACLRRPNRKYHMKLRRNYLSRIHSCQDLLIEMIEV